MLRKVFTRPEQLCQETITLDACLQIRFESKTIPTGGFNVIEYTPWQASPFSNISREAVIREESDLLIAEFM